MKLWEIKAQSLRLMFADTDIQFSEEEFVNKTIYENSNTREKLTRMDDSIRRAIDTYYFYVGEPTLNNTLSLIYNNDIYFNEIDLSKNENIGYPTRVDAYIYYDNGTLKKTIKQIDFNYFMIDKTIKLNDIDYTIYQNNIKFVVWYKTKKLNIPLSVDELTYDLDTIYIPEDVQRMIPYFVKGELYEEDEPNIANNSKMQYVQYLMGLTKPFNQVQTKVKRARIFDK